MKSLLTPEQKAHGLSILRQGSIVLLFDDNNLLSCGYITGWPAAGLKRSVVQKHVRQYLRTRGVTVRAESRWADLMERLGESLSAALHRILRRPDGPMPEDERPQDIF